MTYYVRPSRKNPSKLEVDIKVRLPDGTMFRERRLSPVSGKDSAKRWAQARERAILMEGVSPKAPKKHAVKTLAKFWPEFIASHAKANNQKPSGIESKEYHFRQYLSPVLGELPLNEITNAKVAELKRFMTTQMGAEPTHKSIGGKKSSTINNCLSTLSKCLKCAVDWEVITAMPCRIDRLKKSIVAPRFYDFEAYESLVSAAAALDARVELVTLLGGDAGLRRGEILALEQARCDTKLGKLRVELNQVGKDVVETKGMEFRAIPMTSRLSAAIKAHRHLRGPRLLYSDDGGPVTASMLRKWLAAAQKAAGLPKASGEVHILRHTFCSHLAMRGAPVGSIQKLAGHKHLATTIRYMHLADGETDRAIRLLENNPGAGRDSEVADSKTPR
jgi:integrase